MRCGCGAQALLHASENPQGTLSGGFGASLAELGQSLTQDAHLQWVVNRHARRFLAGIATRYGASIVTLVSDGEALGRAPSPTASRARGPRSAVYPHQRHAGGRAGRIDPAWDRQVDLISERPVPAMGGCSCLPTLQFVAFSGGISAEIGH
jgi:hypothetical protein